MYCELSYRSVDDETIDCSIDIFQCTILHIFQYDDELIEISGV